MAFAFRFVRKSLHSVTRIVMLLGSGLQTAGLNSVPVAGWQ